MIYRLMNRLLKKLRQKDSHQVELEKKEQGFTLYLNGANLSSRRPPPTRGHQSEFTGQVPSGRSDPTRRIRPSKTAGMYAIIWARLLRLGMIAI